MATKVSSLDAWFDNLSGGEWRDLPDTIYKFPVRVALPKFRPSRHECFELVREMGMGQALAALAGKPMEASPLIVFPERYCSIQEQHVLMSAIVKNPTKLKMFRLVTQSPLIISNFLRTQIRIVTWPEDQGIYDESTISRWAR